MALESSGEISLGGTTTNRSVNVELGKSQNAEISMDDAKVRLLTSTSTGNQLVLPTGFHGKTYTAPSIGSWPTGALAQKHPLFWGNRSYTNATFAQVIMTLGFFHDASNDRVAFRYYTSDSGQASSYTTAYINYTPSDSLDNATFQAKAVYSTTASGNASGNYVTTNNPDSFTPSSGTWTNISKSGYTPTFTWDVTVGGSATGTRTISGQIQFFVRAVFDGDNIPDATGISSNNMFVSISATRGTSGGGGGGGL